LGVQGEPDVVGELIDIFLADTPRLIEAMRAAIAGTDAAGVYHAAHTLKSSCASMGALRLSGLSAEQEALSRSGHLNGAAAKLALIEAEYEQVRSILHVERMQNMTAGQSNEQY
jgi:HPt (histidine-containing phosphotransfer) domain-containing protein